MTIEKFMDKVMPEPNTGCWLGLWKINHGGYCQSKKRTNDGILIRGAHRISYYMHFGAFDYSLSVCHKCDVPCCVNPDHLFLGTMSENILDMHRKGRNVRGSKCHTSKLSNEDVLNIVELKKLGHKIVDLSNKYNVDRVSIGDILQGKFWSHLTGIKYSPKNRRGRPCAPKP